MELSLKTKEFNLAFEQEVFDPHVAIKLIEVVSGAEPQRVTQKNIRDHRHHKRRQGRSVTNAQKSPS